jgi:transcriptional regulator with XRE-family HTH domain
VEFVPNSDTTQAMNLVGEAVRRLRDERGLTQQQLADRSGLGFQHISMLERGERPNPTLDTLTAIALGFGMSLPELLAEAEGPLPEALAAYLSSDAAPSNITAEEIRKLRLARVVLGAPPSAWDYNGMLAWLRSRR